MVAIFRDCAKLSSIMLRILQSLSVIIVAVVIFAACGEAFVSQVSGELDKATKGCEHCEHCESGTELVDKKDGSKESGEEVVASKDTNEESGSEKSDVKKSDDSKESSEEE